MRRLYTLSLTVIGITSFALFSQPYTSIKAYSSDEYAWWNNSWAYRIPVTVSSNVALTTNHPLFISEPLKEDLIALGVPSADAVVDKEHIRVIAQTTGSTQMIENLPVQVQTTGSVNTITSVIPNGYTSSHQLFVYFDIEKNASSKPSNTAPPIVKTSELDNYQGQPSVKVETPTATYIYHKQGGGFASIIDNDGNDWISYKPSGGSAGNYRGIPNLVHPEGFFHPGDTGTTTEIKQSGSIISILESTSTDGKWKTRWEIYPTFAKMTLLNKGSVNYWFLYEGTPGGSISSGDYYVSSSHSKTAIGQSFAQDLADAEWIYFGDDTSDEVLFVGSAQNNTAMDSYFLMENNMTVFGFGRKDLNKYLTEQGAVYTIGLTNNTNPQDVIKESLANVSISTKAVEKNSTTGTPRPTIQPTTTSPSPTSGYITPTSATCRTGDLDCSGKVNAVDLTIFLSKFGTNDAIADLDGSGKVNAADLTILLQNFGKTG